MRKLSKIIALILMLTIIAPSQAALAQSGATSREGDPGAYVRDFSPAEVACSDLKPDLKEPQREFIRSDKSVGAYRSAIGKLKNGYHEYINCIFAFAEWEVLTSLGGGLPFVGNALQPLSELPLAGWMIPSESCIGQEKLREIVEKTHPDNMLPAILETYNEYRKALDNMNTLYDGLGTISGSDEVLSQVSLDRKGSVLNSFRIETKMEVDNALVAIDISFAALKELRLAFTIHVGLQCLLGNLEKYRNVLSDIRDIMEILPSALRDASMSKG